MLGAGDVKGLVADLADELAIFDSALSLEERINPVAATMACLGWSAPVACSRSWR